MQSSHRYVLSAAPGTNFAPEIRPVFSPKEMLGLGVFEGKYCNDCRPELLKDWFENTRIAARPDAAFNCFGVKSRQPLLVWRQKGWIIGPDPRGLFQWYCRYHLGCWLPEVDLIQIHRWHNFTRHAA